VADQSSQSTFDSRQFKPGRFHAREDSNDPAEARRSRAFDGRIRRGRGNRRSGRLRQKASLEMEISRQLGMAVICFITSILLLSHAFTSALKKERASRIEQRAVRVEQHRARVEQSPVRAEQDHAISSESHLQDELGTAKRSLIVNVNTASAKELESLPGIGPSRADEIIAHRPYKSVDELSQVKGITQRITDQLRPFVKTDGETEKRKPTDGE
jgi:competence ComEA-like helix-hairpin-helix protein